MPGEPGRSVWQPWMQHYFGVKPWEVREYTEAELVAMAEFVKPADDGGPRLGESPTAYRARVG